MNKSKFIFAVCILINNFALADDDNSVIALDKTTVVAVANKQLRPIAEVVGSVSIINAEAITATNSESMADALRYESNIHIENAGTRFGESGINIRGIGLNRVAVEIDGTTNHKQFSIGSYANATSQFPDTDLIKNIEILNGPASTLYGSNAIGGIVSINTWDPADLTSLNDNNRYHKLRLGYDGKTHGRVFSAMSAWDNGKTGAIVAVNHRDGKGLIPHDSFHAQRDFSDWDQQSIFSKFVINTAANNTLKFGFTGSQRANQTQINSFIGQGRFSRTSELLTNDNVDNYRFTMAYDYAIDNTLFDDAVIRAYLANTHFEQDTHEKRRSRQGSPLTQFRHFEYEQQNFGIEINLNKQYITNNAQHNIIYGIDLTSASIEELRDGFQTNLNTGITTQVILGETFPRRDFPNSRINELGIFMLDEITFDDSNWTVIPAIRFDYYDLEPNRDSIFDANGIDTEIVSISETDISPKLGFLYQLNEQMNIYAQYVRGFRAPPFDDVNIGLNIPLFNIRAIANPDLKSETSNGFELGFRYFGDNDQFNLTVFYTDYSNFIESNVRIGIDPESGTLLFQSRNIDEAEIYGVEIANRWQINNSFSNHTTLGWTRGDNKITNQPINTISPAKLVNNIAWVSKSKKWNINLYSTLMKSQNRIDETAGNFFKPAGYAVHDLFINVQLSKKQQIHLGVFNLFNKKYWNWQSVRNFDENEPIINALSKPSRTISVSYSITL